MFCRNCGTNLPDSAAFCANCGTAITGDAPAVAVAATVSDAAPAEPPTSDSGEHKLLDMVKAELGRDYRIERELGRGGMAVVYKGVEVALERTVALKVVPPDNANAGQAAERFRREAKLAASLDHPNIIPVYRVGQAGPLHYMAMKFVEGRAVDAIIEQQGALPIPIVVAILRAAAAGLAFAHEKKIIHRDIKPANILVDKDGRVMVSDFGIARALEEVSMTASGMMVGTPYYMSPEQCGGQKVSPQSDQYSLGIMGFQLLTGEVPFLADSMVGVIQHHYMTPVPDILAVREGVPKELLDVVYCALNKDPNDRFASTKDMVVALDNVPLTEQEREEADILLRQLSAGQQIPKVRTGTLPPLNLTISGPGPRVQPRPSTMPRPRATFAKTGIRRRRRKKNKTVVLVGASMFAALFVSSLFMLRQTMAQQEQARRDTLEAAQRDSALTTGRVVIAGLPEGGSFKIGASVFKNGQVFVGDVDQLYSGEATARGFATFERQFTVRAGETDTLTIKLQPQAVASSSTPAPQQPQVTQAARSAAPPPPLVVDSGTVRFSVNPLHAEIVLNNRVIGSGRAQRSLPVGTYVVTFRAPGCDSEELQVNVTRNDVQIVPLQQLTCR